MRELVTRLRGAATVQIDEAALGRVQVTPAQGSVAPALTGPLPGGMLPGTVVH